ncbi:MAG TPA: elongator complex protein 3 [Thermoplasmata archaeon]|nr:elongator complex protein 3 [Thermoplasmata archaeon]
MARGLIAPRPAVAPSPAPNPAELHERKLAWMRSHPGGPVPTNVEWLRRLTPSEQAELGGGVRRKPTRTLSGVAIVAVMTAPSRCPHGQCTYCPGGVDLRSPQSYTGEEPSALRGAQFGYDARAITEHRLATLEALGHPTSKVEAIVMGGTFPAQPATYQESVFRGIYEGLNGAAAPSLAHAQWTNERAARRLVSLTVETRPDWCDERVLPRLLDAGVTRVEIGVECLHDEVLVRVGRAHASDDVRRATAAARSRGLKVAYHWMLGLPGMDPERDLADFQRLFDELDYRPDMLKIYPTLVLPGTPLFDEWKRGEYTPYDTETATALLARMKALVPPWVRIQRIQRDIPARLIAAGVRASNIRQLALERLRAGGGTCRCLRCREVGRRSTPAVDEFRLVEREYRAGGGLERFLSFEEPDTDTVGGFLRLRYSEESSDAAPPMPVVREVKVLGTEVAVGTSSVGSREVQHRGLGRALVGAAEADAAQRGHDAVAVLSAVGSRAYFERLGYSREGAYMVKRRFAGRNVSLSKEPVRGNP